jgi:cytochrome b involved in lipid metabolism
VQAGVHRLGALRGGPPKSRSRAPLCRYDVTDYVEEHPGGYSILNNAGGDATEGVYGPQHPVTTFLLLEEYCIGRLASGEEEKLKK